MKRIVLAATLASLLANRVLALDWLPNSVFVRVVDVGAGLCCVVKMPDDKYFIYDAGNRTAANPKIAELIPSGSTIGLLVLSHSDADHIGSVSYICNRYKVKEVVHSGLRKATPTWTNVVKAIKREVQNDSCIEFNLASQTLTPGTQRQFGGVTVTLVFGRHQPPPEWGFTPSRHTSEYYNSGSIVVRLTYQGKSVLFCGDSVGRLIDDPPGTCIAAERAMCDSASSVTIDSDVMIAAHHGADNGSSTDFIRAVSPEYVIFSAGTSHKHPRLATANRYLGEGVALTKMFRTDLGDKRRTKEWRHGSTTSGDGVGDDDVDILIEQSGNVTVAYRN